MQDNHIDKILEERGKTYGPFIGHATCTQRLKMVIAEELAVRGKSLDYDMQEAVEMTMHKIGRIVNGDPTHIDSWDDIAGYNKLVADRLRGIAK